MLPERTDLEFSGVLEEKNPSYNRIDAAHFLHLTGPRNADNNSGTSQMILYGLLISPKQRSCTSLHQQGIVLSRKQKYVHGLLTLPLIM